MEASGDGLDVQESIPEKINCFGATSFFLRCSLWLLPPAVDTLHNKDPWNQTEVSNEKEDVDWWPFSSLDIWHVNQDMIPSKAIGIDISLAGKKKKKREWRGF